MTFPFTICRHGIEGHRVGIHLTLWETNRQLLGMVEPLYIPPVIYNVYSFSTHSPLFGFVNVLNFSINNGCSCIPYLIWVSPVENVFTCLLAFEYLLGTVPFQAIWNSKHEGRRTHFFLEYFLLKYGWFIIY